MAEEKKLPEPTDLNEEKTLFEWDAPERAFKTRDRDFWVTAISILVLVSVALILIKEFYLIIALISLIFLYYVLSTVKPENVGCRLTNRGLYFGDHRYEWATFYRFWFGQSLGQDSLFFETILRFPRQVAIVINPQDKEKIKEILIKKMPMVESSPTFVDKLTKWFAKRLPLEDRNPEVKKPESV